MFIYLKNFNKKKIVFDKPGRYVVYFHNVSGEIRFEISAENVDLYVFGLYSGKKNKTYSLKTSQIHYVGGSFSQLLVKSIMKDESSFYYDGLIRIEKQATKTHAYQKNMNILLSEKAHVVSQPYLEILTNDVFCTHGSTTGQLDKEMQYYLQTRGYACEEAKDLLEQGFINDIIQQINKLEPDNNLHLNNV